MQRLLSRYPAQCVGAALVIGLVCGVQLMYWRYDEEITNFSKTYAFAGACDYALDLTGVRNGSFVKH